jgi:hypothetical protein
MKIDAVKNKIMLVKLIYKGKLKKKPVHYQNLQIL